MSTACESSKALRKTQWEMRFITTCSPEVCVRMWERRREMSQRRDVVFRQNVIETEMTERKLLQERCPKWVDNWVRPVLLNMAWRGEMGRGPPRG